MTEPFEHKLREHLRGEASRVTRLPDPVADGVRAGIGGRRFPGPRALAPAAIALVFFVLLGVGLSGKLGGNTLAGKTPVGAGAPSPSFPATASPSALPSPPGSHPPPPPARCDQAKSAASSLAGHLVSVRAAGQSGFDRVVFEFTSAGLPEYQLTPQSSATFTQDASGRQVNMQGNAGMRVLFPHATEQGTYTGPTDLKPGLPLVKELGNIGDFENVLSWGIGLNGSNCYRVSELQSPPRLVLDFATP
jgi:hypothetical protein